MKYFALSRAMLGGSSAGYFSDEPDCRGKFFGLLESIGRCDMLSVAYVVAQVVPWRNVRQRISTFFHELTNIAGQLPAESWNPN